MTSPFLLPVELPPTPTSPEIDPDPQGAWQRQHASALLLGLLSIGRSIFNFIPAIAALGLSGNSHYIPLAFGGYALFLYGNIVLRWWMTRYRVGPDSFSLREGVLDRNERHIGFDRVQDISIEQGMLQRFLGVARISIETGAGSGEDISLSPIHLAKAEELREILRAYRQQAPAALPQADETETATIPDTPAKAQTESRLLFALTPKNLLLSGLFSPSLAILALFFALIGFADRLEPLGYKIPSERELIRMAEAYLGQKWFDALASPLATAALIALAGVALTALSLITGVISTIFRDWDYRLRREDRTLRRSRGLTTRTDVAITIRRIQSATLVTGLIRQIFGWQELRLRSLASDIGSGEGSGDHQAISFARRADINPVLQEINLLPQWDGIAWQRSHILLALPPLNSYMLLIASALCFILPVELPLAWPLLGAAILSAIIHMLGARRHFHAVDGDKILIRSGLFRPTLTILPLRSIQSADICDNFVYRRFGLATLSFGVPGISRFADDRIPAIALGKATKIRTAILHRDITT